jgi:hypothetical protein
MAKIPIDSAKNIAWEFDWDQVIIVAWNKTTGMQHVTTYGKMVEDCEQAAQGGNFVKKALGWSEEECNAKPRRVRK